MLKLKIQNKSYKLKTAWKEMTAGEAVNLDSITVPDKFMQLLKGDEDERKRIAESITDDEAEDFTTYYKQCLGKLSNIPDDVINRLHYAYVDVLFLNNIYPLIFQMKTLQPDIEPYLIKRFGFHVFKHVRVQDITIPHIKMNIEKFAQMQDMVGNISSMLMGLAFLIVGNDSKAVKYEKKLRRVKMHRIWRLFFYSFRFLQELRSGTLNCLVAMEKASKSSERGAYFLNIAHRREYL